MDFFRNFYYCQLRNWHLRIGTWPYERSNSQRLRFAALFTYILVFFILQILRLIKTSFDLDILFFLIPSFVANSIMAIKLITAWVNLADIRNLLGRIKYHWEVFSAEAESNILKKYAKKAKLVGNVYVACTEGLLVILLIQQLSPCVLDIALPLNESRPRRHMFEVEYFVEKNDYYYPILAHMAFAVQCWVSTLMGTDMAFISTVLHACGICGVVAHRFQRAFEACEQHPCKRDGSCSIMQRLEGCIKSHRILLSYTESINACYSVSFGVQCLAAVSGLTVIFLQLFNSILIMDVETAIVYLVEIVAFAVPTSIILIPGEVLLDLSSDLFQAVYRSQWYMACGRSQKTLVLVLQLSKEPLRLLLFHYVTMSLETLVMVMKAPISYFMVLNSKYSDADV